MPKVSPMEKIKAEARGARLKEIREMLARSVTVCMESEVTAIVAAGLRANTALTCLDEAIQHLDSLEVEGA